MIRESNHVNEAARIPQKITVISGGVGGAKFLRGVVQAAEESLAQSAHRISITAIVNTGDDIWLNGLRVCPDLDSVMYALAGVNDTERGWGRSDETQRVASELAAYGVGHTWFTLGDLDIATHIARSQMLRDGIGLTEATRRLSARWDLPITLLPATEQEVETFVRVGTEPEEELHFEEWWVRYRATMPALEFIQRNVEVSHPAPGVLTAIHDADLILIAPSNPVVSIGTVLGIPGIREAVQRTAAPVVGLSPIIGDSPVLGMAAQCLATVGVEVSPVGVARHLGARSNGGILDGWIVDASDAQALPAIEELGIAALAIPLWMTSAEVTAEMVRDASSLVF